MTTKKRKRKHPRHAFHFRVEGVNGSRTVKAWADVKPGRKKVELPLTAAHVRKSITKDGIGNTQTCSMAVCALDHAESFPHKIEGGYVDWTYGRAFVSSRVNKKTLLPNQCYVYEHRDEIARLNDTPGGQQKLLKLLEDEGPRTITLFPMRVRSAKGRPGSAAGRKATGARSPVLRGAKLRAAVAHLGGV